MAWSRNLSLTEKLLIHLTRAGGGAVVYQALFKCRLLSQQHLLRSCWVPCPPPGGLGMGGWTLALRASSRLVGVASMYPSSCNSREQL